MGLIRLYSGLALLLLPSQHALQYDGQAGGGSRSNGGGGRLREQPPAERPGQCARCGPAC